MQKSRHRHHHYYLCRAASPFLRHCERNFNNNNNNNNNNNDDDDGDGDGDDNHSNKNKSRRCIIIKQANVGLFYLFSYLPFALVSSY